MAKLADPAPLIDDSYSNQHDFTCDNGAPVGSFVILRGMIATDTGNITSVNDTAGNTWNIDITMALGSNVTVFIISSRLDTVISNGDTISIHLDDFLILTATCSAFDNVVVNPFDWGTGQVNSVGNAWSSGTVPPTTYANELLIGVAGTEIFTSSMPDTGWIEEDDYNSGITSNTLVTQYQIVTVSNSYENSGSWADIADSVACICTYQMTASTPPTDRGITLQDRPLSDRKTTILNEGIFNDIVVG